MKRNEEMLRISVRALCLATTICVASTITASAAITPFTGVTLSPSANPAGGAYPDPYVDSTANMTSFTTAEGTVSDLSHAVSGNGNFLLHTSSGTVRNFWGINTSEIDGVESVLNLDLASGVLNAGDNNDGTTIDIGSTGVDRAQFFFSQEINAGVPGDGNDFFLVESGGNDTITVVPLDASGTPIGDFSMTISTASSHWGVLALDFDRVGNAVSAISNKGALPAYAGVAFDLEDFTGTGTLSGVAGIGWDGTTGLDALVVGVNSQLAPVPEPATSVLFLLAALLCSARRPKR